MVYSVGSEGGRGRRGCQLNFPTQLKHTRSWEELRVAGSSQAGESLCVCVRARCLTTAGSAGARLPAVELPEVLSNLKPLRQGVRRAAAAAEMARALG